jgi:hypothetical protein
MPLLLSCALALFRIYGMCFVIDSAFPPHAKIMQGRLRTIVNTNVMKVGSASGQIRRHGCWSSQDVALGSIRELVPEEDAAFLFLFRKLAPLAASEAVGMPLCLVRQDSLVGSTAQMVPMSMLMSQVPR